MGDGGLSARGARTFYNVADALVPPGPGPAGAPGAGDVDLLPALHRRWTQGATPRGSQGAMPPACTVERWLARIERAPRLRLRPRFSKLPREERVRLLARWEGSPWPARRAAARGLRELVTELWETARAPDQSLGGA